jgi:hypothetical protein
MPENTERPGCPLPASRADPADYFLYRPPGKNPTHINVYKKNSLSFKLDKRCLIFHVRVLKVVEKNVSMAELF